MYWSAVLPSNDHASMRIMATRWRTGSIQYMYILTSPYQARWSWTICIMFLSINNNQQTKPKLNYYNSIWIMCFDMRIHTWAKTSSFLLVTSRCFLLSSDFLSWHSIDISLLFKSGTSSWNRCQLSASSQIQESCAEKALHSTFKWHSGINKSIVWSGRKRVMRQFRNRLV